MFMPIIILKVINGMETEFYTVKELMELLKVSESWIMRRIKTGKIPSYKFGKQRRFKKEEINQWIESQKDN